MQAGPNGDSLLSPTEPQSVGITIPPLPGTIGHMRQKPSRAGLGERQYSYDITTGPSARLVQPSNPSPPPSIHHRQYSEGAGGERSIHPLAGGRNASVSSLDTPHIATLENGLDGVGQSMSGAAGRRRHGHSHSHAHSHHHHPNHLGPIPAKPASMMSTLPNTYIS